MRGNKVLRVLGIILEVVAVIGLLRFLGWMGPGTAGANAGIFLCPGILAAAFLTISRPEKKEG